MFECQAYWQKATGTYLKCKAGQPDADKEGVGGQVLHYIPSQIFKYIPIHIRQKYAILQYHLPLAMNPSAVDLVK